VSQNIKIKTFGEEAVQLPEDGPARNKDEVVQHGNIDYPQPLKQTAKSVIQKPNS
jgi:hypothetical protein